MLTLNRITWVSTETEHRDAVGVAPDGQTPTGAEHPAESEPLEDREPRKGEPRGEERRASERETEEELDAETRQRRDAALRHVRKLGDPVLRTKALPVERFDEELRVEAERMDELMQAALGIGLAATQVGILHRVLVYRAYADDPTTVLVNPEMDWVSDERESAEEGCLSLPGVHVEVERPVRLRVRGRDVAGRELQIEAEGLEARVIQHEIDHLDGILILDRISREARRDAMRALREAREGEAGGGGAAGREAGARDAATAEGRAVAPDAAA
jgi:peptide deformylase